MNQNASNLPAPRTMPTPRDLWLNAGNQITRDDRRLYRFICEHFDMYDVARGAAKDQKPNLRIEKHLNAGENWHDKLAKLQLWEVARMRRGGFPLYLKPSRKANQPATIALRFDADAHHDEPDASALIDWISNTYFSGRLYDETSTRGWSGYAVFDLQPIELQNGDTVWEKKERTNATIKLLDAAMQVHRAKMGFKAAIEVKGSYTSTATDDEGCRKIVSRGSMVKLPTCRDEGDVVRLVNSQFPVSIAHRIISDARRLVASGDVAIDAKLQSAANLLLNDAKWQKANMSLFIDGQYVPQPPATVKRAKPSRKSRRGSNTIIEDTGSKVTNRNKCVSMAIRQLLGTAYDPDAVSDEDFDAIVEGANAIYEQNKLNGHERDGARDKEFHRIARRMVKTHRPMPAGAGTKSKPGGVWFVDDKQIPDADAQIAEQLARSRVSRRKLNQYNRRYKERLNGVKLSYRMLGLAICTYAKNRCTSEDQMGGVPSSSVPQMLRAFGLRADGGTAAVLREILVDDLHLFSSDRTWTTGRCERFTITSKVILNLPFLKEAKLAQQDRKMLEEQHARYIGLAGGTGANDRVATLSLFFLQGMKPSEVMVAPSSSLVVDVEDCFGGDFSPVLDEFEEDGAVC